MQKDYYYVVNPRHKIVCESYSTKEDAEMLASMSNGKLFDHFPYEEYGYEDPYNFIAEWSVYSDNCSQLKVKVDWKNRVTLEEGV